MKTDLTAQDIREAIAKPVLIDRVENEHEYKECVVIKDALLVRRKVNSDNSERIKRFGRFDNYVCGPRLNECCKYYNEIDIE